MIRNIKKKKKNPPTIVINIMPKLIYLDHNRNYPYVAIIEGTILSGQ